MPLSAKAVWRDEDLQTALAAAAPRLTRAPLAGFAVPPAAASSAGVASAAAAICRGKMPVAAVRAAATGQQAAHHPDHLPVRAAAEAAGGQRRAAARAPMCRRQAFATEPPHQQVLPGVPQPLISRSVRPPRRLPVSYSKFLFVTIPAEQYRSTASCNEPTVTPARGSCSSGCCFNVSAPTPPIACSSLAIRALTFLHHHHHEGDDLRPAEPATQGLLTQCPPAHVSTISSLLQVSRSRPKTSWRTCGGGWRRQRCG